MINWKAVITGFVIAVVITLILSQIIGDVGSYIGVIIAGITVGYIANRDLTNGVLENRRFSEHSKSSIFGAIHGGLIGIIGGIVALIIIIIVGGGPYLMGTFGIITVGLIIADIILGAIGGAIGSRIA